jgi:hypothetical protein
LTATNHAMTGAAIMLLVGRPAIALPLAFISHFILDALPHFGSKASSVLERNRDTLFRVTVAADTCFTVVALVLVPYLLHHVVAWWLVLGCMLAAYLPDTIWIPKFFNELKTGLQAQHGWFARFHQWIQWGERPWGLAVELVWLVTIGAAVTVLS